MCRLPSQQNLDRFFELLDETLDLITKKQNKAPHIFCGDLNIDISRKSVTCNQLYDIFACYNLSLANHDPTRITPMSKTVIDHFFTNIDSSYVSSNTFSSGISDHCAVTLCINCVTPFKQKQTKFLSRKFHPSDIASFAADIGQLNWDDIFYSEDETIERFD